ncbi:MAG: hypothetical protein RR053_07900, partial [Evtepia sp.]
NPFFAPLIEICRKNGIQYRVFMPDLRPISGYGENAGSSWFLEWGQIALRKVLHRLWCGSETSMYRFIGKTLALLTFGVFRADICITNAGIYMDFLPAMNPHSRIVDLQHGVIYSTHPGYFDAQGRLLPLRDKESQIEYWVYGEGYRDCFFKNPQNARRLLGKVHVVGDVLRDTSPLELESLPLSQRTMILFSFQFVNDFTVEKLNEMKRIIEQMLSQVAKTSSMQAFQWRFRHHPRFSNCISLSDWEWKFPWFKETHSPINEILPSLFSNVTFNSTMAFDVASRGVPTIFLDNAALGWKNVFFTEYDYPFPVMTINDLIGMNENEYVRIETRLKKWYALYYSPFDTSLVKMLLLKSTKKSKV